MAASLFLSSSSRLLPTSNVFALTRRCLTASEITTALRPFYFLVHPDLFGRFPKERTINENSIQTLKCFVDDIAKQTGGTRSTTLKFYLRPPNVFSNRDRSKLKLVTIRLDEGDVRKTILKVLRQANLPTSFVDSIPIKQKASSSFTLLRDDVVGDVGITATRFGSARPTLHKMDVDHPLAAWLEANVNEARRRIEAVEPIVLKCERLKDEICDDFGVADIAFIGDWLNFTRINKLEGLRSLLVGHAGVTEILRDRVVLFTESRSGITVDGHLALFVGEVLENWLWHIRQIPFREGLLENVPKLEDHLSKSLRNIQIVRRKSRPVNLVDEYKSSLKQLLASMTEFGGDFPSQMPKDLSQFELSVETGGTPTMISPEGQFIVPCNASVKYLLPFLARRLDQARSQMADSEKTEKLEMELIVKCIAELGLVELRKSVGLPSDKMTECCTRLLQFAPQIRHLTHGNCIEINSYYDINPEGFMTIPHFWLEEHR